MPRMRGIFLFPSRLSAGARFQFLDNSLQSLATPSPDRIETAMTHYSVGELRYRYVIEVRPLEATRFSSTMPLM
jgi:hypothetical protein